MKAIINAHAISVIKQQATRLKKSSALTHIQSLDAIATMHGYAHWKHLLKHDNSSCGTYEAEAFIVTNKRPFNPEHLPVYHHMVSSLTQYLRNFYDAVRQVAKLNNIDLPGRQLLLSAPYYLEDISHPLTYEFVSTFFEDNVGLFYIQGKPASGKTTLIRGLLNSYLKKHPSTLCTILAEDRSFHINEGDRNYLTNYYDKFEKNFKLNTRTDAGLIVVDSVLGTGKNNIIEEAIHSGYKVLVSGMIKAPEWKLNIPSSFYKEANL